MYKHKSWMMHSKPEFGTMVNFDIDLFSDNTSVLFQICIELCRKWHPATFMFSFYVSFVYIHSMALWMQILQTQTWFWE